MILIYTALSSDRIEMNVTDQFQKIAIPIAQVLASCNDTHGAARYHLPLSALIKDRCSITRFPAIVKIAGVFAADHPAVDELVGKFIDSNPRRVSIDLGVPILVPCF